MGKCRFLKTVLCIIFITSMLLVSSVNTLGNEEVDSNNKYTLGEDSLVNTGKDNGFSDSDEIDIDDFHWGWQLGEFYLKGFTRVSDEYAKPLFLKNVGDTVALWFDLKQDIDKLNDSSKLSISFDTNGWDQHLGVPKQEFGRGMLIIKHTDYQNNTVVNTYQDFLAAKASTTAATEVELFEEGDYEVALDYEIKKTNINILGWKPLPSYYNYRISFEFSVRNGNCMAFPFDVKTKEELTNTSITENGFYLDLAKSRYLDIDIKKEVLIEGAEGLTEDIRFNKPAKDGNEYTDEGIYTITVSNRYTEQITTKKIYVGSNDVLKAHVVTGLSISEINGQIEGGATVADDGTIIPCGSNTVETAEQDTVAVDTDDYTEDTNYAENKSISEKKHFYLKVGAIAAVVVIAIVLFIFVKAKRMGRKSVKESEEGEEGVK